jgi:hypothetical protein
VMSMCGFDRHLAMDRTLMLLPMSMGGMGGSGDGGGDGGSAVTTIATSAVGSVVFPPPSLLPISSFPSSCPASSVPSLPDWLSSAPSDSLSLSASCPPAWFHPHSATLHSFSSGSGGGGGDSVGGIVDSSAAVSSAAFTRTDSRPDSSAGSATTASAHIRAACVEYGQWVGRSQLLVGVRGRVCTALL